jgi:hypothetical protein
LVGFTLAMFAMPTLAHAAGEDACIAASEKAQRLKNDGKLSEARDQLALCSADNCPSIVRTDCNKWMGEVLAALPSVVLAAKDAAGKDIVEAKVLVDGKVVAQSLDGRAIKIDPGVHLFRFEASGYAPGEERVVVRSGEQNRIVSLKLDAQAATATPPPPPPPETKSNYPFVPIGIGFAGAVVLAVAIYIDTSATSDAHDLRKTCAPECAQSKVDSIKTRYLISGIMAGVGAVGLGTGAVLYYTRKDATSGAIGIAPTIGGAVAQGRISF